MSDDDQELLADIGYAVASIDERLAGVEAALTAPGERQPARRRRPQAGGATSGKSLRRAQQRRRDAGGIIWTVWAFDSLSRDERVQALEQIRTFVDWLNKAYELPLSTWAVPSCWFHHAGAIRELWALVASHRSAYTTRVSTEVTHPTEAPGSWHDRSLWPCLRRLREELGLRECAASGHRPLTEQAIATDDGFGGAVEKLAAG